MSALDTAMLAAMREAIAELLPDSGQIITITNASDGQGGFEQSRGTASAIACRIDFVSGQEKVIGAGVQPYSKIMLSLPYDTAINEQNQFLHNGVTYAVTSVNNNQSWQAVKRVELEKLI